MLACLLPKFCKLDDDDNTLGLLGLKELKATFVLTVSDSEDADDGPDVAAAAEREAQELNPWGAMTKWT